MEKGFTLLELLISMAIVSILTAVAVPQYNKYREKSFDIRAQADLRNIAIAQEAYFLESESYLSCQDNNCSTLPGISTISEGVTLQILAEDDHFTGTSTHPKGSGKTFAWDSNKGGLFAN